MAVSDSMSHPDAVEATRRWIETVVIGHNLCPFAKREYDADRVRLVPTQATTIEALIETLVTELEYLIDTPAIETTLIIHPAVLTDFMEYNQFLDAADELLRLIGAYPDKKQARAWKTFLKKQRKIRRQQQSS